MYPRWLWQGFSLPGVVWLILLFIVPFYAVTAVAFGSVDPTLLTPIPVWNPLQWNAGWVGDALSRLEPGGDLWGVFVRTCEYVAFSLGLSLAIGYPVAYYIARHASRTKSLLLILLILPLWVSYLMRMLAWVNLLAPDGYVNRFLHVHARHQLPVRLARRPPDHGHPRPRVRLHPLPDPAAVRLPRPDRQEPHGGRPRPGREPVSHIPARHAAPVEDRHPRRLSC